MGDDRRVSTPTRQVRAQFTAETITVYQAYSSAIASPAIEAGTFVAPFSRDRMTWIKPSFLWMMYRSGWATKPGQERVLAVEISRAGFEWAIEHACLSHFVPDLHGDRGTWKERVRSSPVRVQWDPERSVNLVPLPHRSLQVGLSGTAVHHYVDDWIAGISDITPMVRSAHLAVLAGDPAAGELLPVETPYPLPPGLGDAIGAD